MLAVSFLLVVLALRFLASSIFLLITTICSEAFFLLSLATVTDFVDGQLDLIFTKSVLAFFKYLKRVFLLRRDLASFF